MSPLNNPDLEPPPEQLCRINGIAGILLLQEGRTLINDFPLHPFQTDQVAVLARKMCQGFQMARRVLRQIVIGYPCGQLVIVSRDDTQMVLLLLEDTALDPTCAVAAAYLDARTRRPLRLPSQPAS